MNKNTIKLFGSKKTDNWQTPPELYKELNREFKFTFDPCPLNPTFDGLNIKWKKRCFVNPPYSFLGKFLFFHLLLNFETILYIYYITPFPFFFLLIFLLFFSQDV